MRDKFRENGKDHIIEFCGVEWHWVCQITSLSSKKKNNKKTSHSSGEEQVIVLHVLNHQKGSIMSGELPGF